MSARRQFEASIALAEQMRHLIPGGAHTYAKADDQYPLHMAPVIVRGAGAHVWDADGNVFVEYGSGLRSVALGHAHPAVVAAATRALAQGTNFARPAAIELDAARALLSVVPRADMVKFAKNGSDVTTAAVRLARAHTGRDLVALCADQPFFSVDDWFIGSTAMARGVPQAIRDLTLSFPFDDLPAVEGLLAQHPDQVACLILEAATARQPSPGYFDGLRRLCDDHGVLLVLDEMITGFRWSPRGAQDYFGIQPDLSTFGKALGNGMAVAALAGRREYMRLGGFDHDDERVFLLSTTHGAESHALAGAIATIEQFRDHGATETLWEIGSALRRRLVEAISAAGVAEHLRIEGAPCNLVYATLDCEGNRSQDFRTLLLQELLGAGVIAPSFVVSTALTEEDIDLTAEAVYAAAQVYRKALDGSIGTLLRGRPVRPALRSHA